ncbi:MAG: SemiSWEET family transporter, partial [Candidatus Omnitrophica bacterium]|nr:SemiSWEET family transporter [Candidatus Omnitrophota bacterium]
MFWTLVGTSAAVLTTLGFFTQALKIYRTQSSKDVSLHTLVQFLIGVILWMLYGIHINDTIVIFANAVSLVVI